MKTLEEAEAAPGDIAAAIGNDEQLSSLLAKYSIDDLLVQARKRKWPIVLRLQQAAKNTNTLLGTMERHFVERLELERSDPKRRFPDSRDCRRRSSIR